MASSSCGGGGRVCGSQCARGPEDEEVQEAEGVTFSGTEISTESNGAVLCSKCGEEYSVYNKLCLGCFRSYIYGKFKLAVTSNGMISPVDSVLVAFSGGPASRLALQFTHEMQLKSQKNWDASKDQSLPVFGVGVAFIDESAVALSTSDEVEEAVREIKQIVSSLCPAKHLYIRPIESLFSSNLIDGRNKLNKLIDAIGDATGKEDFLQYLRIISLQKIASDNGYSKLVLGSCTTGMACHIISATVKGQGYSLPADLQYIDARWDIPLVLPLRDCIAQELIALCQLDGLKTLQISHQSYHSINSLVSSFMARLHEENPSRARTIVRTAEKLTPFSFNKFKGNVPDNMVPSRLRRKLQSLRSTESATLETLCLLCGAPLSASDLINLKTTKYQEGCDVFTSHCCASCNYQVLPKDAASSKDFFSLLPQPIAGRVKSSTYLDHDMLREQVKEFLLSDEDEGS